MPGEADLITVSEAAAKTGYTGQPHHQAPTAREYRGQAVRPDLADHLVAVEVYRRSDAKPGPKRVAGRAEEILNWPEALATVMYSSSTKHKPEQRPRVSLSGDLRSYSRR